MKLVVGLGNPGREYTRSRHNVGFMVLDALAERQRLRFDREKFKGLLAQGSLGEQKVALLKPLTYMNLSGESVQPAAAFFKVEPSDLVVTHDDLDLPFGRMQIKVGGGTAGHNGLKSIAERMGTKEFVRVRVGIGHPGGQKAVVGHVLSGFGPEEEKDLEKVVQGAAEAVQTVVTDGPQKAMNAFNGRDLLAGS